MTTSAHGRAPVGPAPENWAGPVPDPLTDPARTRRIGEPMPRLEGLAKVTGRIKFAAEHAYPGMLYAALACSTIPKGRITALDVADAERAPGVVLVMTHRNAPRMNPMPGFGSDPKAGGFDTLPVLQDDRVHWNGQPIAVVLAETQEQADHAATLIRVGYAPEPAVTSWEEAVANGTAPTTIYGGPGRRELGDAEAALRAADVSVDEVYRTPYHNHAAIEPHAATVLWDGDELFVHDTTQMVAHSAWSLAKIFGIPEERVHISAPYLGGGFGGKGLWWYQVLAAAASRLAGRPVRIALTRENVFRTVGSRARTEQRVAIGATADGRFEAIIHTGASATSRSADLSEPFILPAQCTYAARTFKLGVEVAYLDMMANTSMRAPGGAVGSFALECAIDELAVKLGMDPIELRLRNEPRQEPIDGRPLSARNLVRAWRAGAERFGWDRRNPTPGAVRDGEWLIGMGCAAATHPYVRSPGAAARITLHRDGRAEVEVAAHDMGMGTATAQTQVIADRLGLEPHQVTFRFGDSRLPGLVMAGGSQQTAAIGAAVAAAHRELLAQLLKLVGDGSPLGGLEPDQVGSLDGGVAALDDPSRHESYADILDRAGRDRLVAEAVAPPPEELTARSMHSFGAMFCEVRVSSVTGEVRVTRFLGSMDCGRIVNPRTAASQFRGGIIMGIGLALTEELVLDDRTGRVVNASLADYHIPVHLDVPEIDLIWTDIPDPHAPMGARGIGEIGITGTGAAIANAVYNATGRRVRDLPITPDKLL
jgi:xanthine dehydrogenase YagR molybdenum-binding subunit